MEQAEGEEEELTDKLSSAKIGKVRKELINCLLSYRNYRNNPSNTCKIALRNHSNTYSKSKRTLRNHRKSLRNFRKMARKLNKTLRKSNMTVRNATGKALINPYLNYSNHHYKRKSNIINTRIFRTRCIHRKYKNVYCKRNVNNNYLAPVEHIEPPQKSLHFCVNYC